MVIRASRLEPASEGSAATSSGVTPPELAQNRQVAAGRGLCPAVTLPLTRVGDRHARKPGRRWARVRPRGGKPIDTGPRAVEQPAARGAARGAAPGAPAERPGAGAGREHAGPVDRGEPAADPAGAARAAPPGMAGGCRPLGVAPGP